MSALPHTRAEAKAQGATRYYTGQPCKHGHVAERQTSNATCVVCLSISHSKWQKDNPDKVYCNQLAYFNRHPEKRNAYVQNYLANNKEKRKVNLKNWRRLNSDKHAAKQKRRDAAKLKRTPQWLTSQHHAEIGSLYWLASDLQKVSGEKYHVDHIVPLQGKNISGLHVPWNLQILPADMNCSKSNFFEGDTKW